MAICSCQLQGGGRLCQGTFELFVDELCSRLVEVSQTGLSTAGTVSENWPGAQASRLLLGECALGPSSTSMQFCKLLDTRIIRTTIIV